MSRRTTSSAWRSVSRSTILLTASSVLAAIPVIQPILADRFKTHPVAALRLSWKHEQAQARDRRNERRRRFGRSGRPPCPTGLRRRGYHDAVVDEGGPGRTPEPKELLRHRRR